MSRGYLFFNHHSRLIELRSPEPSIMQALTAYLRPPIWRIKGQKFHQVQSTRRAALFPLRGRRS